MQIIRYTDEWSTLRFAFRFTIQPNSYQLVIVSRLCFIDVYSKQAKFCSHTFILLKSSKEIGQKVPKTDPNQIQFQDSFKSIIKRHVSKSLPKKLRFKTYSILFWSFHYHVNKANVTSLTIHLMNQQQLFTNFKFQWNFQSHSVFVISFSYFFSAFYSFSRPVIQCFFFSLISFDS